MNRVNTLRLFMNEMGNFPLLTADEEIMYAKAYKENGDTEARDMLINCNLRLVVNIAKKYHNSHLDLADLIAEGSLGLMQAVDKYNPDLIIIEGVAKEGLGIAIMNRLIRASSYNYIEK